MSAVDIAACTSATAIPANHAHKPLISLM
jgi:hypothetical protein